MTPTLSSRTVAPACTFLLVVGSVNAQDPVRVTGPFINFESTHVRPIALAPDGSQLFVCNTPDNRLAIFATEPLALVAEFPVGLEPVAVAVHPLSGHVWVSNQLSDSVSLVDPVLGYVVATIDVGDEPSDLVFHPTGSHAFVTLSGARALAVIDTATYAVSQLSIDADTPRAMTIDASAPTGVVLYVASFHSGNNTTVVPADAVLPADQQSPSDYEFYNAADPATVPPPVARIVLDTDPNYPSSQDVAHPTLPFDTLDNDILAYDVNDPASGVGLSMSFKNVGTLLNSLVIHSPSGRLLVTNTDARNIIRFEPELRGHLVNHQLTIVNPAQGAADKHDLHAELPTFNDVSTPNLAAQAISLAEPMAIVARADGTRSYLTAHGVDRVGVLDIAPDATSFTVLDRIDVGRGPSGLALDETSNRLYCVNRIDHSLTVIDVAGDAHTVIQTVPLGFNPEPPAITNGRRFLYTSKQSNNWGSGCATCHAGGENDRLMWDLGDPGGEVVAPPPPNPFVKKWHPMKGPMRTQTLRGLVTHERFHFRADRANFVAFNGAFDSLLGGTPLSPEDMTAFRDFIHTIVFPPNPHRNIDNSFVDPMAAVGKTQWINGPPSAPGFVCNACHSIVNDGTTDQFLDQEATTGEPQLIKITQLRNLHDITPVQYAGFGFRHDGTDATLLQNLLQPSFPPFAPDEYEAFVAFQLAFPTNVWPVVGHQVTVDSANAADAGVISTLNSMIAQANNAPANCNLTAKGPYLGSLRGFFLSAPASATFQSDRAGQLATLSELLDAAAAGQAVVTFTAVPPGGGPRIGIDRDLDGFYDQTEIDKGSDPANAASLPNADGDADDDGDFDLFDAGALANCFSDEVGPLYVPGCGLYDFDNDGDVGSSDFAAFAGLLTGP